MAAFVDTEKKLASICFICKTQNKTNTAQLLKKSSAQHSLMTQLLTSCSGFDIRSVGVVFGYATLVCLEPTTFVQSNCFRTAPAHC